MQQIKKRIQEAFEIGKRNQEIINLTQNFCKHLQIEKPRWSGTGIPEQLTGLPIGARACRCKYARAHGLSGMDFKTVALDFYERNCSDCHTHEPVGLPNLSTLVEEKDKRQQESKKRMKEIQVLKEDRLKKRREGRLKLRAEDGPRNAILDLIEEVDSGSKKSSEKLVETAKIAFDKFDKNIQEALFELVETNDFFKTECAIEALTIVANRGQSMKTNGRVIMLKDKESSPVDINRLVASSLKALSCGAGHNDAATVVDFWLDESRKEYIDNSVIERLIRLAFPSRTVSSFGVTVYRPGPLLKVYSVVPQKVLVAIENMLRNNDKWTRIAAAGAARYIIENDNDFGVKIANALLQSLNLPDDMYDGGSSQTEVAETLGFAMVYKLDEMDKIIQEAITNADSELKSIVFSSYEVVFDDRKPHNKKKISDDVKKTATKRILETLLAKPNDGRLEEAARILNRFQYGHVQCLRGCEELLIGAAAAISEELNSPYSPIIDTDPNPIKALESSTRNIHLRGALNTVKQNIGYLSRLEPTCAGQKVIECVENLSDTNDILKTALIASLGYAGSNPQALSLILPTIAIAFVDKNSLVRASAVEAYGELIKGNRENLPTTIHELFCASLSDPYVIVHKQAVQVLWGHRQVREEDVPVIRNRLMLLILAYQQEKSDVDFLARCIDELLNLYDRFSLVDKPLSQFILKMLPLLRPYERINIFKFHKYQLKEADNYPEVLASLLIERDIYSLNLNEAIEIVKELQIKDMVKITDILERSVKQLIAYKMYGTSLEIIELLSRASCWDRITSLANAMVDSIEDTIENKPLRLQIIGYSIAANLELAILNNNESDISRFCDLWSRNLKEIREDEEKNTDRRNFFRGIRLPC